MFFNENYEWILSSSVVTVCGLISFAYINIKSVAKPKIFRLQLKAPINFSRTNAPNDNSQSADQQSQCCSSPPTWFLQRDCFTGWPICFRSTLRPRVCFTTNEQQHPARFSLYISLSVAPHRHIKITLSVRLTEWINTESIGCATSPTALWC
jgi:hypothetical protein